MNAEIAKRVASVELRNILEEQEAENQRLQRENRIQELSLARSRIQLILLIVLLASAATAAAGLAYLHRHRKQIRTLRGLIPICAHCKKIRNDEGYYEQLEQYLTAHSEAQFSHGICEDCAREHFGFDLSQDEAVPVGSSSDPGS